MRIAVLDRLTKPGRAGEQLTAADDVEDHLPRPVALRRDPRPDAAPGVGVVAQLRVALGHVHVRLREREGRVVDRRPEEGPLAVHRAHPLPGLAILVLDLGERGAQPVPRRNHAAALRPCEDPRDRAEIVEGPLAATSRGPRRDRQVLDFLDRGRLLEVRDEARLVDQFAVHRPRTFGEPGCQGGPLGGRRRPPHGRGDEGGPRHLLEVASCDLGVVVAFREHLALLGQPERPVERLRREREDAPGGRTAAAPERSAAPVEEREVDAARRGRRVETLLCRMEAAAGREVAAVLRAVRIPHHHDLAVAEAGEVLPPHRFVEHRRERDVRFREVVDLLEKRRDRQVPCRDRLAPRQGGAPCLPPEPEHAEHVRRRLREADDRAAHALRAEPHHGPVQDVEEVERVASQRADRLARDARHVRPIQRVEEQPRAPRVVEGAVGRRLREVAGGGEDLAHDLDVGAGVLTHVEARHVEAEGAHEVEPATRRRPLDHVEIAGEAVDEQGDVRLQNAAARIPERRPGRVGGPGEIDEPGPLEAEPDHADPATVDLVRRVAGERPREVGMRRLERRETLGEAPAARARSHRDGEQVVQPRAPREMGVDRGMTQPHERGRRDVRRHEGITVAIPAHPRTEAEERGHVERMPREVLGERAAERGVHLRHGLPDARHDRQAAVHLVEHGRPRGAEELRLPDHGQLVPHVGVVRRPFPWQQVVAIEIAQPVTQAPELRTDGPPLGLARMGREDEVDAQAAERLLHVVRREPQRLQFGDAGGERFTERLGGPVPLPLPEHADALTVLGDVHEVEVDAEGTGHEFRVTRSEARDAGGERLLGGRPTGTALERQTADIGDQIRHTVPGQITDDIAEGVGEMPDVAAEKVVGHDEAPGGRWEGAKRAAWLRQHRG